jgi:hypothetical protein
MALRKFSLRAFLKKNFDFITGVLSEIGLTVLIMGAALAICLLLVLIKSVV